MKKHKSNIIFLLVVLTSACLSIEAAGKVLRTHLQDENYDITLLPNELKALKTFNTELLVVEDYLQQNNNTEARNRYDEIPATCELTRYVFELELNGQKVATEKFQIVE